jgi:hypothetical protein
MVKLLKTTFQEEMIFCIIRLAPQPNTIETTNKGKTCTQIKKTHLSNYNLKTNVLQQIPNNMDENFCTFIKRRYKDLGLP